MTADEIRTVASVASVLVAIAALAFAYIQWKKNRTQVAPTVRKDEVRAALGVLITQIDTTQVTTIHPHSENWEYGIRSLETLRSVAGTFNTAAANSPSTPDHIKITASELLQKIRNVLQYRDSLHKTKGNRQHHTWQDYDNWPDKRNAENGLHELQGFIRARDTQLRDYMRSLN